MDIKCYCSTCLNVKRNLSISICVHNMYKWVLDSYVLDFYSEDLWNKLPTSWQNCFQDMSFQEMSALLKNDYGNIGTNRVLPLSILALRNIFKTVNIIRSPQYKGDINEISQRHNIYKINDDYVLNTNKMKTNRIFDNIKLRRLFWKHVKQKKIHEISLMADICAETAKRCNCDIVLDFGSGLGHLSRILAYGYNLKVCSLEVQESFIKQAKKLDTQFESFARKYMTVSEYEDLVRPIQINIKLTHQTDLIQKVKSAFQVDEDVEFGIVGLHPCGDLAAILLRFFKENSNVKFINLVGCCYMKISTQGDFVGYPLSKYLLSKQNYELSYATREMSCHAIETYIERLNMGQSADLKIHSYRAALEKLIIKYYPNKKHSGLRNVKSKENLDFISYFQKATEDLKLNIPFEDLTSQEINENLSKWERVVLFYSLRLLFAPMVESIILSDRFLFVANPNIQCRLLPIFDPKMSPRNHILIAIK